MAMDRKRALTLLGFFFFHASVAAAICGALQASTEDTGPIKAATASLLLFGIGLPLATVALAAPFLVGVLARLSVEARTRKPLTITVALIIGIAIALPIVAGVSGPEPGTPGLDLTPWLAGVITAGLFTTLSVLLQTLGNTNPELPSRWLGPTCLIGTIGGASIVGFTHGAGFIAPLLICLGLGALSAWFGAHGGFEAAGQSLVHGVARSERASRWFRRTPDTRDAILFLAGFAGLVAASWSDLPVFWQAFRAGETGDHSISPAFQLSGLFLGFGLGSVLTSFAAVRFPSILRPFGFACLVATGLAMLAALLQPALSPGFTGIAGFSMGFLGCLHRRYLYQQWGARGIRLPREIETAVLLALGLSLCLAGSLVMVIEQWSASPWVAPGILMLAYPGLAFSWWKRAPLPRPDPEAPPEVPWIPGYALDEERQQPRDARSVTIRYAVPESNRTEFLEIITDLKKVRQLEGALQWRLSQDLENPELFTESYLLESWSDYQEALRHETPSDRDTKQRIFNLNDWDSLPLESHEALEGS